MRGLIATTAMAWKFIALFQTISNSLGENLILSICGDKNGHIYIRTQAGINEFSLGTSSMKTLQRKYADAIDFGIQDLWISEGNKLYNYKNGKKEFYSVVTECKSPILKIYQTVDQRIILGSLSSGVFVIDQNKKVRVLLKDCSQVSHLFEDSKKNIWISTWDKGLFKIDRSGTLTNYTYNPKKPRKFCFVEFCTRGV